MHWTDHMQKIIKKIAAIYKTLPKDHFIAGSKILQDYECSKMLLQIDEKTWQEILRLVEVKSPVIAEKISMLLCYISELKRLASVNVRELTGLSRDEIATLQRVVVSSKISAKNRDEIIKLLTNMVAEYSDADTSDKTLLEHAYGNAAANIP